MLDRRESLVTALTSGAALMTLMLVGCGGSSSGLTTDEVTMCTPDACTLPRPAGASTICSDNSIAGPSCIKHSDGTCGWAILSCPIQRGPTAGHGGPGGSNVANGGGGGITGTGGAHGGAIGTGGAPIATGGVIGTGSGGVRMASGGVIGTGGYIPTGGVIGTGGYIPTGGVIGTGGIVATGGVGMGGFFGTGGSFGTGGLFVGSISWSSNGQSISASGYYEENLALSGTSFIIRIAANNQFYNPPCELVGQFPTVPPAPGIYPIGDYKAKQADGTFVGACSMFFLQGIAMADPSVSGTVVLSQSAPGLIEGSFVMHALSTGFSGIDSVPMGMVVYTGAFSVGCRDNRPLTDPACAARTIGK